MIKDYCKRNNPLKPMAQASEFYVPGIRDRITKTSEGLDTFKDWSDLDLLSNKEGWEELGISKGTFLSGMTWCSLHFHHLQCLNHKQSSMRLGRHFEDTNRTGWRKQGPLCAVERRRDIKIVLQNKLTKTRVQAENQPCY